MRHTTAFSRATPRELCRLSYISADRERTTGLEMARFYKGIVCILVRALLRTSCYHQAFRCPFPFYITGGTPRVHRREWSHYEWLHPIFRIRSRRRRCYSPLPAPARETNPRHGRARGKSSFMDFYLRAFLKREYRVPLLKETPLWSTSLQS